MMTKLNENITIISSTPIIHLKGSEKYVSVIFKYQDTVWEGFVPIEYRRTGTYVDFNNNDELNTHLNIIYKAMCPRGYKAWRESQNQFWATKPGADVTKEFFDILAEGGWKCGSCKLPNNVNSARRIQDLKEFGYTIATDLHRYCEHCGKKTCQRILLPIPRGSSEGNGYETLPHSLRKRIIRLLGEIDVYENTHSSHCLPDHKFPEIRWDDNTKGENPNDMTDDEIKRKFQLLTNQRNQQKREVCRNCYQKGERGTIYGIPYYYQGGSRWSADIPRNGKEAERGCIGCAWYDIEKWRYSLLKKLKLLI